MSARAAFHVLLARHGTHDGLPFGRARVGSTARTVIGRVVFGLLLARHGAHYQSSFLLLRILFVAT